MNKYKILNDDVKETININYNDYHFQIGDFVCFNEEGSLRKATQNDHPIGIIRGIDKNNVRIMVLGNGFGGSYIEIKNE